MIRVLLIIPFILAAGSGIAQSRLVSKIGDREINVHKWNPRYPKCTIVCYTNQAQTFEFELSSILHYNSMGSGNINGLLVYNEKEFAAIKNTNPKLNYNFSHSILTKGLPYNEFIKRPLTEYRLNFNPTIKGIELLDRNTILFTTSSGAYMIKVSPWGGESELVLLKENEFDAKGMVSYGLTHYIEVVDPNTVKLSWSKYSSQWDAKDDIVVKTYTIDRKNNKLLEVSATNEVSPTIEVKTVYKNLRKPVGDITQYLSKEYQYYKKDSAEIKHGFYRTYHPNINKELHEYGQYDHNRKTGLWVVRDKDKIYFTDEYSSGVVTHKDDGITTKTEFFYNDKGDIVLSGKVTETRDELGILKLEGQYDDNKQTGTWKYYSQSLTGKAVLNKSMEYQKGEANGPAIYYWENGKKNFECIYQDGVVVGKVKEYNESGFLIRTLAPEDEDSPFSN